MKRKEKSSSWIEMVEILFYFFSFFEMNSSFQCVCFSFFLLCPPFWMFHCDTAWGASSNALQLLWNISQECERMTTPWCYSLKNVSVMLQFIQGASKRLYLFLGFITVRLGVEDMPARVRESQCVWEMMCYTRAGCAY